jgi:hypothetical protein
MRRLFEGKMVCVFSEQQLLLRAISIRVFRVFMMPNLRRKLTRPLDCPFVEGSRAGLLILTAPYSR